MIKRILVPIIVLAVLIVGVIFVRKSLASGADKGKNQYRTAKVSSGQVKKTVTATGVLKPWTTIDIKSRAGGRVIRYGDDEQKFKEESEAGDKSKPVTRQPISEGSIVTEGQLLVEIDPSDVELTLNSAKADITANKARIDEAQKSLDLQTRQVARTKETAFANLEAARASSNAQHARFESAKKQADIQERLSHAATESARQVMLAEQQRLTQMEKATQRQQRASAQATLDQAIANRENAEKQLHRQQELLTKGFIAASQVDQAQASYSVAMATERSARERMETITDEQSSDVEAQRARVRQTESQLNTAQSNEIEIELRKQAAAAAEADWKRSLADVKQAEATYQQAMKDNEINIQVRRTQITQAIATGERSKASLANATIQYQETKVVTPAGTEPMKSGEKQRYIVLKKYVEQGTLITSGISFNSTGTSIVQLGDLSRMYVDVQVDETDIAKIDLGQKVEVTFDAYSTQTVDGTVIKIEPQAVLEQNVTTFHVRVEVDRDAQIFQLLKPGMNASCEFMIEKKDDVVSVPNEALKSDDKGRYVEIASGGKVAPVEKGEEVDKDLLVDVKIERRDVKVGLEGNDSTEVTEGVKPDETIITQTIEPSTAPPPGGNPFGGGRGPGRR